MQNLALYRKYRPQKFSEVVGQAHITETLKRQVELGKISHAYLFCGSRGIGKTTVARIFAKAINCNAPLSGEACEKCSSCEALSTQNIDIIEIDAASNNRVDEIRELREKIKFPPVNARYKVYIIDEVHMLTDSAFNALLKTLEEPPAHAVFILATTEPQKLPATILSRCVRFDFKLVSRQDLIGLLKNVLTDSGVTYDEDSLALIADAGEGSARDTLSIADMCVSFCNSNLTYEKVLEVLGAIDRGVIIELNSSIISGNIGRVFEIYNTLTKNGKGINILIKDILKFYRDLIVAKSCTNAKEMLGLSDKHFNDIHKISQNVENAQILNIIDIFSKLEMDIKNTLSGSVMFETALIKATLGGQKKTEFLAVQQSPTVKEANSESKIASEAVKEPIARQAEAVSEAKVNPSLTAEITSAHNEEKQSFAHVFGRLLTQLKEHGYMALYGTLCEVTNGEIDGGMLVGFVSDEASVSFALKQSNLAIINNILKNNLNENLAFSIKIISEEKPSYDKLNSMLGGKLKIEE